jgi:hypothetical protein
MQGCLYFICRLHHLLLLSRHGFTGQLLPCGAVHAHVALLTYQQTSSADNPPAFRTQIQAVGKIRKRELQSAVCRFFSKFKQWIKGDWQGFVYPVAAITFDCEHKRSGVGAVPDFFFDFFCQRSAPPK